MNTPRTATEYARVSKDKSGRLRSVAEQTHENREAADDNGWDWLPTAYAEDGDVSASVFGTVPRIGFAALLADLRSGAFPADVLVLWEPSRGSRQMREWVDLIDALAAGGVRLHVTSEGRTYDVRRAKDRRDLQDAANEAEYYSGRLSTTLKRAHRAQARDGRWSGKAPFGYRTVHNEDGEKFRVIDAAAAGFVREAYDHVAAGGSIAGLVARWNASGVTGRTWSTQALRVVLLNPAYVGVRVHTPRSRHERRTADAQRARVSTEHEAAWEPIVEREVADRVRVILADASRLKHRSTGVTHLLSNIAVCGACDAALTPRTVKGRGVYTCPKGCVQVTEAEVDAHVRGVTIAFLAREGVGPVKGTDQAAVVAARAEVEAAEAYLREVEQAAEAGTSPLLVAKMQAQGEARLGVATAELRRVSLPDVLKAVLPAEPMSGPVWDDMGLVGQRRLLRALYGPDGVVGPVRVDRVGKGQRVPVGDRVRFGDEDDAVAV